MDIFDAIGLVGVIIIAGGFIGIVFTVFYLRNILGR